MEGLALLGSSLAGLLGPWPLLYALGATLVGIVIGLLPGLSATLGIALMTTLTVKMAPTDAILVLICVYVGAAPESCSTSREPPPTQRQRSTATPSQDRDTPGGRWGSRPPAR
jgi:TctA family transporter